MKKIKKKVEKAKKMRTEMTKKREKVANQLKKLDCYKIQKHPYCSKVRVLVDCPKGVDSTGEKVVKIQKIIEKLTHQSKVACQLFDLMEQKMGNNQLVCKEDCVEGSYCDGTVGKCVPNLKPCLMDCKKGFQCQNGSCKPIPALKCEEPCKEGFVCYKGKCIEDN